VVLPVNLGQRNVSLAIPPESTPRLVRVSSTEPAGGRFILAQAQSCGILHLDIGGNTVEATQPGRSARSSVKWWRCSEPPRTSWAC